MYFSHISLKFGRLAYFEGLDFIRLASKTSVIANWMVIENLDRTLMYEHKIPYVWDTLHESCYVILQLGHMKYT